MQRSRRRDPIPWTWEIPFGICMVAILVLALGVQLGRSGANLAAGSGWHWPARTDLFASIPGILGGNARTGLTPLRTAANAHLVWLSVAVVEVLAITAMIWALKVAMDRWGPNRLRGMATAAEAETMLGRTRLRKAAPVVRPDLYGNGRAR